MVAGSTSSSVMASWRSGMLRLNALTTLYAPVLLPCGPRAEWNASTTCGRRRPRIHLRIGLNCATVLVGNVGSSTRLSYTALGDGVNVAARLEGINKLFGTTICISDSIYDRAKADIIARPLKRVQVKGRKTEFMIYELLALRMTDDPEVKVRDRDEQLSAMTCLTKVRGRRFFGCRACLS